MIQEQEYDEQPRIGQSGDAITMLDDMIMEIKNDPLPEGKNAAGV